MLPSAAETLYQDERIIITRREQGRLIHVCRTALPSTIEWLDAIAPRVESFVARTERPRLVMLFDTRLAPLTNTPEMEARQRTISNQLMIGYKKCVVLVRTALGVLQVNRFNRERAQHGIQVQPRVFDDEAGAMAYLLGREP